MEADAAARELARRYLAGYGPATAQDLAAWSGLPATTARRAFDLLAGELVEVPSAVGPLVTLANGTPPGDQPPRLLGHFDAYLLGYRDRDLILDTAYAKRVRAGGGMIAPAVLVDGRVVGTWRLTRGSRAEAIVEPFTTLPRGSRAGLHAEADDLARFLGTDLALTIG
jgi:winged helix DNA-binding protein